MKTKFFSGLFACVAALNISAGALSGCTANDKKLNVGSWTVTYDTQSNGIDIQKDSRLIFDNVYASYKSTDKGNLITSRDYSIRNPVPHILCCRN